MVQIPAGVWAALSTILATFGVVFVPSDQVKSVAAAAGGLVLAVYQWQHHKTKRHHETNALELAGKRLDAKAQAQADAHDLERVRMEHDIATRTKSDAIQVGTARDLAGLAERVRTLELAAGLAKPLPPADPSTITSNGTPLYPTTTPTEGPA